MNASERPYSPSWYDRLFDWISALPGPTWAFYVALCVGVGTALNLIVWAVGYVAVGTFDPFVNSGPVYLVIGYAGMQYLDWSAGRAWATIRPATRLTDDEAERFAFELTTMPAGPALAATLVGLAVGVIFEASQYGRPFDIETWPIPFLIGGSLAIAGFIGTIGAFYHALHQLRLIGQAHRFVDPIDLLHLQPLYAFAGVTAASGILLMVIGYLALPTNPVPLDNPVVLAMAAAAVVLAIVCFVVPLIGMHDAIAAEKGRRLASVNRLLADGLAELHRRAEGRDLAEADALNKHLASLLAERDVISRASTWPWAPDTLRGFSAAIVIPIALWLVYRFLELVLT